MAAVNMMIGVLVMVCMQLYPMTHNVRSNKSWKVFLSVFGMKYESTFSFFFGLTLKKLVAI